MKNISTIATLNVLLVVQLGATEVTRKQQAICPQNPQLVQDAGSARTREEREEFVKGMQKASKYVFAAACVCGAAALGCVGTTIWAESTKVKIGAGILSVLLGAASYGGYLVSCLQAQMAKSQELVETPEVPDKSVAEEEVKAALVDVADGIHIFSGTYCPPCKLLHAALPEVRTALPGVAIFEYTIDTNDVQTDATIKKLGVTILSIPLTVVVKNNTIVRIIAGYDRTAGINDFIQKVSEALK